MVKSTQVRGILDISKNSNNCNIIYLTGMTSVQKDYFSKRALAFRMLGIGWHIAISLLLGTLGGLWLDSYLDDFPLFTLIGLTLGLAVAMGGLYLLIRPLMKENNKIDTDKEDN